MAKVELNSGLKRIQGTIDKWVYRKNGDGFAIATLPKRQGVEPTAAQLAVQEQFAAAAAYAKSALADPVLGPRYAATAADRGMSPRGLAFSDFFAPPVVKEIDAASYHGAIGDAIAVRA